MNKVKKAFKEFTADTYLNPINNFEFIFNNNMAVDISVISPVENTLFLKHIRSFNKGKGNASKLLDKLVAICKKYNVGIFGTLGAEKEGLNKKELIAWYKRHGFTVKNNVLNLILKRS